MPQPCLRALTIASENSGMLQGGIGAVCVCCICRPSSAGPTTPSLQRNWQPAHKKFINYKGHLSTINIYQLQGAFINYQHSSTIRGIYKLSTFINYYSLHTRNSSTTRAIYQLSTFINYYSLHTRNLSTTRGHLKPNPALKVMIHSKIIRLFVRHLYWIKLIYD